MASFDDDGKLIANGINIELTKEENFESNPIQIEKIITINSNKIGYLMYNQFVGNKTSLVNESFGEFKNEGITDLIIDLRYNGGGSVATCTAIASMITGQFKGKTFVKQNWNTKLTKYWNEKNPESLINKFSDKYDGSEQINSLNLEKVYIITTSESASSSELLINGLKPYIDVIHIGEITSGTMSPSLGKGSGLGFVTSLNKSVGTDLMIEIRGRKKMATVVKAPFYTCGSLMS